MSDDLTLLKRLREDYSKNHEESIPYEVIETYKKDRHEAADRIEQLEAALREAIAIVAAHVPYGYPHLRKALEGKDD